MPVSCKKQQTKKYSSRMSPAYHAKDCKGMVKLGNDGNKYISVPDKNGVYKWVKKSMTRKNKAKSDTYNIHDNGSVPYVVNVTAKQVEVIKNETNKKMLTTKYVNLFLGDNLLGDKNYQKKGKGSLGNSILVEVSHHKYIYIGSEIYSFETDEEIKSFYSPIGNSDVPYPYAISDTSAYFMLDKKIVPIELIDVKKDGYEQFYGFKSDETLNKKIQKAQKPFKVKRV